MPFDNADEYLPQTLQTLLIMDRLLDTEADWCKNDATHGDKMCLFFGAVWKARSRLGLEMGWLADDPASRALERLIPSEYELGQHFNDAPETTFSDIKALLQEAIELESAKVAA